MKRLNIIYCIIVVLAVFVVSGTFANGTDNKKQFLDIDYLLYKVSNKNGDMVLRSLYSKNDSWQFVLESIATADPKWIKLAVLLKPYSDAGASNMLNKALGEALENSPATVFQLTKGVFEISNICSCPDVDNYKYATYEKAITSVERRISSLKKMQSEEFGEERHICINTLEESISYLKKFFGKQ